MQEFMSFAAAVRVIARSMLVECHLVPPTYWQSVAIHKKPEMATFEMINVAFSVNMETYSKASLASEIEPNLPWADAHFLERVGGEPINPGEQWKHWPYANKADSFRDENGQFNHNYMERYWPRYAGMTDDGSLKVEGVIDERDYRDPEVLAAFDVNPHMGIRSRYGDLNDVLALFQRDPLTRQAYLPVWFPEDTGALNGRVPCTLGYHLMRRNRRLNITYFIRSCDLLRHFRDDIYMTALLNMWVLEQLRLRDPGNWNDVLPGMFSMVISSLHMFRNDWHQLFGDISSKHVEKIYEFGDGTGNRSDPVSA